MKPWIRRTLLAVAGAAAIASLAACGHGPRHCRGPMSDEQVAEMRERFIDRASSELALNADQKTKLGTLADALAQQRKAMRGDTTSPRAALAPLIAGPTFDRNAAQALLNAKVRAVQTGAPSVLDAAANFYDSLDATQQGKVRAFLDKGPGHRFGFWNRD